MTDVASLSFQIDTSNVPPAVDQLDKLSDASDKVRGSTRFLVSEFGNANDAITQLASGGRASLASFVQISQNIETLTSALTAMRSAAADTVGTLGGAAMSSALTTLQQQFTAMSTLFGTSTAQLEAFNKQAQALGLNSYQVTSALQRITEAQQNSTPAGQGVRQILGQEGISTNQSASEIARQAIQYAATHQQSQTAYNTLQAAIGPIDPDAYARLMNQPYRTLAYQADMANSQTLGVESSAVSARASHLQFQNQKSQDQYDDVTQNLSLVSIGSSSRSDFIRAILQRVSAEMARGNKSGSMRDEQLLDQLEHSPAGSENAINAEGAFAGENPWSNISLRYRSLQGIGELAKEPIDGGPSWYSRYSNVDGIQDANTNYIHEEFAHRRDNIGHRGIGTVGWFKNLGLDFNEHTNMVENQLGLYRAPKDDSKPLPLSEADILKQQNDDAAAAAQLGFSGFGTAIAAKQAIPVLQDSSPNSVGARLRRLFGESGGDALLNQQIGSQQYIAANASRTGFGQIDQLNQQGFLAGQGPGNQIAAALAQFAATQGVDTGRWMTGGTGGGALTMQQILAGAGGSAALTPDQRAAFQQIQSGIINNAGIAQTAQFQQQQTLAQGTQGIAATASGSGDYQAQVAGLRAYTDTMNQYGGTLGDTKAKALALAAQTQAVTLALDQQRTAAVLATNALKDQNAETAKALAITGAAISSNQPGAFGAAQSANDLASQIFTFKQQNKGAGPAEIAKYTAQITQQQQYGLLSGAFGAAGQLQSQVFDNRATLATAGQGVDARNALSTQLEYADALKTATGSTKTALEQAITSIIGFKDTLDQTNQAITDLQAGISGYRTAAQYAAIESLPPSQQAAALAAFQAQGSVLNQGNSLPAGMPLPPGAVGPAGTADADGSLAGNNPLNLGYAGQPGAIGADRRGVAVFETKQAGLAADANQLVLDQNQHGDKTLAEMLTRWNPPIPGNDTPKYISDVAKSLGVKNPNAPYDLSIPGNLDALLKAQAGPEGDGRLGSGVVAGEGAYVGAIAQQGYQAGQIHLATQTGQAQTDVSLADLAQGDTGSAAMAAARIVGKNVPGPEIAATLGAQVAAASEQLAKTAASIAADTSLRASDAEALATAYTQGPEAVQQAEATLAAQASARTTGNEKNQGYISATTQANLQGAAAQQTEDASKQTYDTTLASQLKSTELTNDLGANPYQKTMLDEQAQTAQEMATTYLHASDAQKAQLEAANETAAQLDVIAQKQGEVAQGMGQIGGAVESTLGNLAFSYQQGPGQGLFARKQISGLLGSAGRSLFDTVIGNPVDNFVTGNLTNAVSTLLGDTPPSSSGSAGSGGNDSGGNGSGSGASQTLGGLAGLFGSLGSGAGNMLLSNGLSSLGSFLFGGGMNTASLIAHTGASAIDPALEAAPSLFSKFGSFFSNLFANGDAFQGGERFPFALGGSFGGGSRTPFATGGGFEDGDPGNVFTDPTTMPMAELGEAGPEAIMPLRRGPDGKLGIAGGGGGGGPSIIVNAPISVGANALSGGGKMSAQQTQDLQRQFHRTLTGAIHSAIAEQSRPGGMVQPQG